MTVDEHAKLLGGVMVNLHSLEVAIRCYLSRLPSLNKSDSASGFNALVLPVGAEAAEDVITNYESLGKLVKKFNCEMGKQGKSTIDLCIIGLRDALAHGRVTAKLEEQEMRIVKFSRPIKGIVKVEVNEIMSADWFASKRRFVYDAVMLVHAEIALLDKP